MVCKYSMQYGLNEIDKVAGYLIEATKAYNIIAISGDLGTGKTSLVKAMLLKLGVIDFVMSPTFTYVIKYVDSYGQKIYHFDLYRLHALADFQASGFEEYLNDLNSLVIIEWPEIIKSILPETTCFIELKHESKDKRILDLTVDKL